ncbi:MAG TPA: porin [Gemmatimonadales bacterium]|nr:porin [Gemmatimonadales bacterium]
MSRTIVFRGAALAATLLAGGAGLAAQESGTPPPVPLPGRYDGGYLVFQSADSAFKYWLDGRIQIDNAWYTDSKNSLANGTITRRARLGVKTTLFTDWQGEIDVDFAGNALDVKDLWIGYAGFSNSLIRIGNFKEPFSLETLTSSKYITFMERSYVDAMSPDRHIGMSYSHWGDRWQVSGGIFGQEVGDVDATGKDEGWGATARFTAAPILTGTHVLHVGIATSRRTPNAAATSNRMRFRARPETYVNQARFLSTGQIANVKYSSYYNAELAAVSGPVSLQGEYTRVDVHRLIGLPMASFNGGYVFVSYFLTGESRRYLPQEGEFDRVYPHSKHGAWEVAARVSTLDLNDFTSGVGILGGQGTNYTLGLTWYVNPNFKFMGNYVRVTTDVHSIPDAGSAPFTPGDDFNVFQFRAALAL